MKVIIVDDYPFMRKGISSVLALQADINVLDELANVEDALRSIKEKQPDIVILDLKLGRECGLEVIEKSRDFNFHPKFLIFTSSSNKEDFNNAKQLGVCGYMLKNALPEELLSALRLVHRGRKYYDPEILHSILDTQGECDPLQQLTSREREVLLALGRGLSNKDIAKEFFITEYTVKKHVSQILSKLELTDRTQAAIYITQLSNAI